MNAHTHMDDRLQEIREHILARVGGALTAGSMQQLTADEVTLLAYCTLREEVMDGGLVQLIYNGYGPFIFLNPFAKAMRLWGLKDFSKLLYEGRKFFEEHGAKIQQEMSDEDFMALFEQFPEADDFDDAFIENEEDITRQVLDHALSIGLR